MEAIGCSLHMALHAAAKQATGSCLAPLCRARPEGLSAAPGRGGIQFSPSVPVSVLTAGRRCSSVGPPKKQQFCSPCKAEGREGVGKVDEDGGVALERGEGSLTLDPGGNADPSEEEVTKEEEESIQEKGGWDEADEGWAGPAALVLSLGFILAGTYMFLAGSAEGAELSESASGGAYLAWLGVADLGETLYGLGEQANALVQSQLTSLSPASVAVILGAGLVTSLSPCTLSVLPLTIGYIGGYEQNKSRAQLVRDSVAFALGLATTLALLGVGASLAGKAYGQIGSGLPIAVSCVAILMGLNLLDVVSIRFPSFFAGVDVKEAAGSFPKTVQAYLAGLLFALAASPCSTPVLATLLGYCASTQDPLLGGALLLTYTTGYVTPLLLAASFTGALKRLLSLRTYSSWINPASGCLLLGGGLYTLLLRVVPESMDHMDHMAHIM